MKEYRVWRKDAPDEVASVTSLGPREAGESYAKSVLGDPGSRDGFVDEFDLVVEVVESGILFSCLVEVDYEPTFWSTARPIGVRK